MIRCCLLLALAALPWTLGGCGYTPKQLGITGPGTGQTPVASHASEADTDAVIGEPGLSPGLTDPYATTVTPNGDQPQRFFGYN